MNQETRDTSAAPGSGANPIPLDLSPALPTGGRYRRFSVRVENLPPGAALSHGHNNGDRTWSLKSDELDGLAYLPPENDPGPCTLLIRVLAIDGETATTVALHDLAVTPDGAPPRIADGDAAPEDDPDLPDAGGPNTGGVAEPVQALPPAAAQEADADIPDTGGDAEPVRDPPPAAAQQADAAPTETETGTPQGGDLENQVAALNEQIEALRARTATAEDSVEEVSTRLAGAMTRADQADAADSAALADALSEADDRIHRLEDELAAARAALSDHEAGAGETRKEIEGALQAEHESELAEARKDHERELQEARENHERASHSHATEADERRVREIDARLAEARAAWELELEHRLAEASAEAEDRIRARLEEARRLWDAEMEINRAHDATLVGAGQDGRRKHTPRRKARGAAGRIHRAHRRATVRRGIVRWGAIAACVAAGIVLYPQVRPMVAGGWKSQLAGIGATVEPLRAEVKSLARTIIGPAPADKRRASAGRARADRPRASVRPATARLRAGPSSAAEVVAIMRRGTRLELIARRGNWVRIRIPGERDGDGWVHTSSLIRDRRP